MIVFASFLQIILNPLYDLIITIIGVVIGELAVHRLLTEREKPKITIRPACNGSYMGFSVSMIKKNVLQAKIFCNGHNYLWEDKNENPFEKVDLIAGDVPNVFYPFQGVIKTVKDFSEYHNMAFDVTKYQDINFNDENILQIGILEIIERATQKVIYINPFLIPKSKNQDTLVFVGSKSKNQLDISLRIIGLGIEEKKDYVASVFLKQLNVPFKEGFPVLTSTSSIFGLELKKKFRFF
jgi:hypothetical protein